MVDDIQFVSESIEFERLTGTHAVLVTCVIHISHLLFSSCFRTFLKPDGEFWKFLLHL